MENNSLERVLYVEDEEDIRAVAELALVNVGGLELKACASGREALEEAEGFAPDLLLVDVMMPDMDGPETLRALREIPTLKDIPAIFMTAKVQPDEVDRYLKLGAADVIAKPFDPMALADQLRRVWDELP